MEKVKDENALSEALAICLQVSSLFQEGFLKRLGIEEASVKITTREPDTKSKKILDLTIAGVDRLLLVEVKERAILYPKQWDAYRAIASERGYDPSKSVFAVIAPWASVDGKIEPKANILRWTELFSMAREASKKESDGASQFLLHEFMNFLETRAMKPFDGFTERDIDIINGMPEASKKLQDCLQELLNRVSRDQNNLVTIQPLNVEVKTYKDYPEIYAWASFKAKSIDRGKAINVWFGIREYGSGGPSLALGVWTTDRMWTSKVERVKWQKKLRGLGFIWDDENEGGFVRPLKSELRSTEKDPNLLDSIVGEIREVTSKIWSRL